MRIGQRTFFMNNMIQHFGFEPGQKKQHGIATLSAFEIENDIHVQLQNMRYYRDGLYEMIIKPGKFMRLHVDRELMMTDTSMERITNQEFVNVANGRVLIAGLGIGLIVDAILQKDNVTEVVVIEKYADVIELVKPYFKDERLKVIESDIDEYVLDKNEKFDTIYFDIWPTVDTENLEQIYRLERTFRKSLNKTNENRWIGSWMKKRLQKMKRSGW